MSISSYAALILTGAQTAALNEISYLPSVAHIGLGDKKDGGCLVVWVSLIGTEVPCNMLINDAGVIVAASTRPTGSAVVSRQLDIHHHVSDFLEQLIKNPRLAKKERE